MSFGSRLKTAQRAANARLASALATFFLVFSLAQKVWQRIIRIDGLPE